MTDDMSNVYIVLTGDGEGERLSWSFIQPLPIGAVLQAADNLINIINRQVIGPAAPQPPANIQELMDAEEKEE